MARRERFIAAINNRQPDRVPIFVTLTPQIAEKIGKKFGLPYMPEDSYVSTRMSHVDVLNYLGNDAVCVGALQEKPTISYKNRIIDDFGIEYEKVGFYMEAVKRPLEAAQTIHEIEAFKFPDPNAPQRYELAKEYIKKYSNEYAIIGDLEATIFELAWNLKGLEDFLVDMYSGEKYIESLLDGCLQYNKSIAKILVNLGCDMIWLGDDVGTQNNMMISPDMYRRYLKPKLKEIINTIKSENSNVKIAYHSCGAVSEIIPDLIDAGIDILNPLQPQASGMNLAQLKKLYGNDIAFFGGVDVQGALPLGTVQDVKEEVKLRIKQAANGGGYILAPAHNIQPDTPLENIFALYEAVEEFGRY